MNTTVTANRIRTCADCASTYTDDGHRGPHCLECRANHTVRCRTCHGRFPATRDSELCPCCTQQDSLF